MVSHVDHTEHDVHVIVTEQGLADLRGLPPPPRAQQIIEPVRASRLPARAAGLPGPRDRDRAGKHTPHLLGEALSWHERYLREGTMQPG